MINGVAADFLTINDRAIHYGDGIFETILCDRNSLFFWSQHYQRLQQSAVRLKLDCPDEKLLLDDIKQLLDKNPEIIEKSYTLKIILTRGAGDRGYRYVKGMKQNRLVLLSEIDTAYSSLLSGELLTGELCLCQQQASINESLAGLKHLNRLENVLARNEWQNQYIDGLMINANKNVIEGSMSNLFAVQDGELFTPDLSQSGVKGVMRELIILLAKNNNIKVSVVNITAAELLAMDEIFISNSLIGMKSVNKLADALFEETPLSNRLFENLLQIMESHAQTV